MRLFAFAQFGDRYWSCVWKASILNQFDDEDDGYGCAVITFGVTLLIVLAAWAAVRLASGI